MAFKERLLKATFVLGQGTFGDSGKNQSTLAGLRMSARINRAGGPGMSTMSLDVWGMTSSMMNQLSTLGMVATTLRRNSVTVEAGDSDGMSTVFQGTITDGHPDFAGAPDVPFRVQAHTGLIDSVAPSDPHSYPNGTDAAKVLASIATKMGVQFENNGVSVALPEGTYYSGSLRNQALQVVKDAGITWNGMEDGTLAIWMPGQSRGGSAPLVSPETGLVGYPSYTSNGIALRTIFNPAIGFGKKIVVKSSLPAASGTFVLYDLNHTLECKLPHGAWFSDLQAAPPGTYVP